MKKLFITLCAALCSVCSFAQKGQTAVGVNVLYGTEISNPGFGVKGQYNITDALRGEASFDYFLKKDGVTFWDINVNLHYLFDIANNVKVYPLAGVTYAHASVGDSDLADAAIEAAKAAGMPYNEAEIRAEYGDAGGSEGKFGVNLGGGIQYDINNQWMVNFEAKYQIISNFDQAVFSVGAAYKF